MAEATEIVFPVGRLVQGHPMEEQTTDGNGAPLVIKSGPNMGQPKSNYYTVLAIPKGAESHWDQTAWGQVIKQCGRTAFPGGQWQFPTFAWKVADGDTGVDQNMIPLNTKSGFAGNWIVRVSSGFTVPCYHVGRYAPHEAIQNLDEIKRGYYLTVVANVRGNGQTQKPGVYINQVCVELSGYGDVINVGVSAAEKFGGRPAAQLPPGASTVPLGGLSSPAPGATMPAIPAAAAPFAMPPTGAPAAYPVGAAAGSVPVTPAYDMLTPPVAAPPVMTPKAGGATYAQFIEKGWTDVMLREQGFVV